MERDIEVMKNIMEEREKELEAEELHPLDPEGEALAEHQRETFDIVDTPVDPRR